MKNLKDKMNIDTDKSEKVFEIPFHFLKWILKVELIILIAFFIIGMIFHAVSDQTKFIIKYHIENILFDDIKNKHESYKNIIQALEENSDIEKEDREFICMALEKEIQENINFIDMDKTIERLRKLRIFYNENHVEKFKNSHGMFIKRIGRYDALLNQIDLYEKEDSTAKEEKFCFSSSNKEVYFHELNHLLTRNTFSTAMDTFACNLEKNEKMQNIFLKDISNSIQVIHKNIFLETINELFSREYLDEYYQENIDIKRYEAYGKDMVYAYGLAEIVSEDTIRKYKFNDNQSILISGLLEIDNNIEEIYKLITSINSVSLYENQTEQIQKENYKRIYDGYAYFYEKKYQKNMCDELEMVLYFYGTPIQTEQERNKIRNFLKMESYDEIINIIPKGYVSKEYKRNHPNTEIEYTKEGRVQFLEIKDEIKEQYRHFLKE